MGNGRRMQQRSDLRSKLVVPEAQSADVSVLGRRRLFADAISGLMPGVNAFSNIVGAVQGILNLFGSHTHEALVGAFQNRGFSDYKSNTEVWIKMGLPEQFYKAYMDDVLKTVIKVPRNRKTKKALKHLIKYGLYVDDNTWQQQSATFSTGSGGKAKNFQVFTSRDSACGKINVIILSTDSTFKLGNDIFVISSSKATFGGAFSTTKLKFEEKPASISIPDVDFVSRYFTALAMKRISESVEVAAFKGRPTCPSYDLDDDMGSMFDRRRRGLSSRPYYYFMPSIKPYNGRRMQQRSDLRSKLVVPEAQSADVSVLGRRRLFADAISGLMPGVNAFSNIVGAVQGILNLFGSHTHEALVGAFQNRGFSDYKSNTEVWIKMGLPEQFYKAYMDDVLKTVIKVPRNRKTKKALKHLIKYGL